MERKQLSLLAPSVLVNLIFKGHGAIRAKDCRDLADTRFDPSCVFQVGWDCAHSRVLYGIISIIYNCRPLHELYLASSWFMMFEHLSVRDISFKYPAIVTIHSRGFLCPLSSIAPLRLKAWAFGLDHRRLQALAFLQHRVYLQRQYCCLPLQKKKYEFSWLPRYFTNQNWT